MADTIIIDQKEPPVRHQPVDETLYSLSDAPPAPDNRREGDRHLTLFRVGSLGIGERRELCLIKNVSAGGMKVRVYSTLPEGTRVTIELKHGEPVDGVIRWIEGNNAGVAFDSPIDVVELLSPRENGPRPRMPRIETERFVSLREGAKVLRLQACDVSQGGMKLRCQEVLASGADLVITLPGLAPLAGRLSWQQDDMVGVSFNRLLPLGELVEWLREPGANFSQARVASR